MGIKQNGKDKILDVSDRLDMEARARFISWVMNEEGVDWDTAYEWCCVGTDRPDLSLGYKMCSPAWVIGFKTNPKKYYAAFIRTVKLSDAELELFQKEVVPVRWKERVDAELKRQRESRTPAVRIS